MPGDQERLASDYLDLAPGERLGAADALSAAALFARERRAALQRGPRCDPEEAARIRLRHDYYLRLYQALARALGLARPEAALAALAGGPAGPALRQALSLRAQVLALATLDAAAAPEPARTWHATERARLLAGLAPIDGSLCALLGWDPEAQVSVARLRAEFGLPALDAATRAHGW